MAVPSLPGSNLVVIQADFSLALFKTLLHGPTGSNSLSHFGKRCPTGCKDEHISLISRLLSRNQTPSNNQPFLPTLVRRTDQFDSCPIELTWSFAPITHGDPLPLVCFQPICDVIHPLALTLHFHLFRAGNGQSIRLLSHL